MLQRKKIFISLSDIDWKTLGSCPEEIWLRSLTWKLNIQGIKFHLISSGSMTRFVSFRLLAEVFSEILSKLLSSSVEDRFDRREVLSDKEVFFYWISDLEQKSFGFSPKKLSRMPNFCSISPEEQFEENNVVKKNFFCLFQTLIKKRWEVAQRSFSCVI